MPGKFEIKTAKNGKVHFNLKASNGQVILTSEKYETRQAAMKGIESVRKNAANEKRIERKDAKDGSAYFVLKAANGEPLGRSEMYKTKRSMENGIASVAKNAESAAIAEDDGGKGGASASKGSGGKGGASAAKSSGGSGGSKK